MGRQEFRPLYFQYRFGVRAYSKHTVAYVETWSKEIPHELDCRSSPFRKPFAILSHVFSFSNEVLEIQRRY